MTVSDRLNSSITVERMALLFWWLSGIAVAAWAGQDLAGWDAETYYRSWHYLRQGLDPYAEAMHVQEEFHRTLAQHPNAWPPFSYVYTPITLPLLRLVCIVPKVPLALLWAVTLAVSIAAVLRVMQDFVLPSERKFVWLILPVQMFFPGLLAQDTMLGGNIAFVLYGALLLAARRGWRTNDWRLFYLTAIVASCFKPPFLTLLVLPLVLGRRQLLWATLTGVVGAGIFAVQSKLFPVLFANFLRAVELQFSYNRDFGSSPSGVLSDLAFGHGIAYRPVWFAAYAVTAVLALSVLYVSYRRYAAGALPREQVLPVVLLATILLNPRLMEYDLAPVTLPMAIIAWRGFTRACGIVRGQWWYFAAFVATNLVGVLVPHAWKPTESVVLVLCFAAGAWLLMRSQSAPQAYGATAT